MNRKKPGRKARGKRNNGRICQLCGKVIFNRLLSALYCKECAEKKIIILSRFNCLLNRTKKEFPEFDIKVEVMIIPNEE